MKEPAYAQWVRDMAGVQPTREVTVIKARDKPHHSAGVGFALPPKQKPDIIKRPSSAAAKSTGKHRPAGVARTAAPSGAAVAAPSAPTQKGLADGGASSASAALLPPSASQPNLLVGTPAAQGASAQAERLARSASPKAVRIAVSA